ncbi:MAG: hypothetical protein WC699_15790 [Bacteroidales bacterium]
MKTMKFIKIIPVVLMGLFLSVNAGAATINDNDNVTSEVAVVMESWMFDSNYLITAEPVVENWMFDATWLDQSTDSPAFENWMLDENYLGEEKSMVESWMMDANYLAL